MAERQDQTRSEYAARHMILPKTARKRVQASVVEPQHTEARQHQNCNSAARVVHAAGPPRSKLAQVFTWNRLVLNRLVLNREHHTLHELNGLPEHPRTLTDFSRIRFLGGFLAEKKSGLCSLQAARHSRPTHKVMMTLAGVHNETLPFHLFTGWSLLGPYEFACFLGRPSSKTSKVVSVRLPSISDNRGFGQQIHLFL